MKRRNFIRGMSSAVIGSAALVASTSTVAGRTRRSNREFQTSDGVPLVGDLVYPTDKDGTIADGPFPVVLTMTPYTENSGERNSLPAANFLVDHGYIRAHFDVRGTGSSGGSWRAWGPREIQDYVELIDWVADLPRSTGKVGLTGGSYMGYNQLLTAGAVAPDSPLETIVPIITATDLWRTVWSLGGLVNATFNSAWWSDGAQSSPKSLALGADQMSPPEFQERMESRIAGFYDSNVDFLAGQQMGTTHAYREEYWRERSTTLALPDIVAKDIPAIHFTGLFELFQPESIEVYTELQNLWAGRDQYAPMAPDQEVTGRYQTVVGPYMHVESFVDVRIPWNPRVGRLWFDRWLKGERNGIAETDTPLHIFQAYGNRWVDAATWPLPDTSVETFYLDGGTTGTAPHSKNDGWLRTKKPAGADASDTLVWRPTSNPCQQAHHEMLIYTVEARDNCGDDNRGWEATALTYTSAPLEEGRNLAGPSCATIYAQANTPQTSWVASLSSVAPDGTSRQHAYGALRGSFRNLREDQSWYFSSEDNNGSSNGARPPAHAQAEQSVGRAASDGDGTLVRPRHEYRRDAEEPVEPGQIERYDILLTPMFARIHPNHRLRLTVHTSAPWAEPAARDLDDLAGGVYQIQRNQVYGSKVNIPFAEGPLGISSTDWGPCNYACGQTYRED
jgi:putative CocE/NonD family hydrolase